MRNSAQVYRLVKDAADVPTYTPPKEMIGEAPAMQALYRTMARLSRSPATVLINGESGTGKELAARALHRQSARALQPFIALNMAAIPHDLLESELFGHERGAFTGAATRRQGRFEQADGGTLFLDEIGDMPVAMQTRLLRVLAEGEFFPVGASAPRRVDVRIIAATHQNLENLVAQGQFRADLFHRLNVIRLHLPPLRERREDIPRLLHHYLDKAAQALDEEAKILAPAVEQLLCGLSWPGNVRQLENACHWMTVMVAGRRVELADLPPDLLVSPQCPRDAAAHTGHHAQAGGLAALEEASDWQAPLRHWALTRLQTGKGGVAKEAIVSAERILIGAALRITRGQRQAAAKRLGYSRSTLARKIRELDIGI